MDDLLGGHHATRTVLHDFVDVARVVIVGGIRKLLKVLDALDVRKAMLASIRSVLVGIEHLKEQLFLDLPRALHVGLKLAAQLFSGLELHLHHHVADRARIHDLHYLARGLLVFLRTGRQRVDNVIACHMRPLLFDIHDVDEARGLKHVHNVLVGVQHLEGT